jgi:threonine/homoserine/homoserine lactone efflux protein
MINYLIIAIGFAFASVVQPGPLQAFFFSQSLMHGWRKAVPLVFAPLVTDGPIIVLVLLVLTNLPKEFLQIIQCAGGVLLLYMAFISFKAWRKFNSVESQVIVQPHNFFKAVMINFFNPGPYLGWSLVMGPLLIKSWNENPVYGITLIIGFYGTMVLSSVGMVMLFASARNFGPRVTRISIGISVIALALFGIYQLGTGIYSL